MILILGASGMLGASMMQHLAKYGSPEIVTPSHLDLDITNQFLVLKYIKEKKPRYIINCAAARGVDWCEENKEKALLINGESVGYIGSAAKKVGAKFVHISTDYVFSGEKPIGEVYTELDHAAPIQVYGASKLLGEQKALEYHGIVLRVQWLYGASKVNFVNWLVDVVRTKQKARVSISQYGSPCSTDFVAQGIYPILMRMNGPQIYHMAHDDFANRWDNAKVVCEYFGVKVEDYFEKIGGADYGPAPRPLNTCLSNEKLRRHLNMKSLGKWRDDLLYYLSVNFPRNHGKN